MAELVSFDISAGVIFNMSSWRGWIAARNEGTLHEDANPTYESPGSGSTITINGVMWLGGSSLRLSVTAGSALTDFPDRIVIAAGVNTAEFDSPGGLTQRGLGAQADYNHISGTATPTSVLNNVRSTVTLHTDIPNVTGDATAMSLALAVPAPTGTAIPPSSGDAEPLTLALNIPDVEGTEHPNVPGDADPLTLVFDIPDVVGVEEPIITGDAMPLVFTFDMPSVFGQSIDPVRPTLYIPPTGTVTAFDDALIVLRDRHTHEPIREISNWATIRFRQNRYTAATGSLDFIGGAVDNELLRQLIEGDKSISIYAHLSDGEIVHYYGTIETVRVGDPNGRGDITYHLHDLPNEMIARGEGQGEDQVIVRTADTYAQARYAFFESQNWQNSTMDTGLLEWKNQDKLVEYERERRTSELDIRLGIGLHDVSLTLLDHLGYVNRRMVDTTGLAERYGQVIAAATMLQELYQSEMIAPTLARRRIDIEATADVADFASTETVRERIRWERLNNVAATVAERADLTLTTALRDRMDGTRYVAFGCEESVDRRGDKPPVTEMLAGEYVDVRIGEILDRDAWLNAQTERDPFDSFPMICVRREFWRNADEAWNVKPVFDLYRRSILNF